jgi:aminoglycoside/choline kinase family phosphotransferase
MQCLLSINIFGFEEYLCLMLQTIVEGHFDKEAISSIRSLAQAGSNRKYYRILLKNAESYIACENPHVEENETFFYFTEVFQKMGIPVPSLRYIHHDKKVYILADLGNESLLDRVLENGNRSPIEVLYEKSLKGLVKMQVEGKKQIDFNKCFSSKKFDRGAVLADLNYFKYYFLDLHEIGYDKSKLQEEFDQLARTIENMEPVCFMFRDFQARNIMIKNETPYFIDYQGGMEGPPQYDVASLLWQAKAVLPFDLKEKLFQFYKKELALLHPFDEKEFDMNYSKILLLRLLQVLGAYGLRGIIERRSHFLSSIPYGLQNIEQWILHYKNSLQAYPVLSEILIQLVNPLLKNKYVIDDKKVASPLKVLVQSFSYKKGIPADESGNGGGFMFDCRGILNPGRFEPYKKLTGRDREVIDFLESQTKVDEFLDSAKKIVDISVKDYIERGFENLQISFGCTGGQHRSVYCTDKMAQYLSQKYGVHVDVKHLIQDEKNWIN